MTSASPVCRQTPPADKGEMLFGNINDGYLEGLLRGFRAGILTSTDYANLCQCETVDGASPHPSAGRLRPPSKTLAALCLPGADMKMHLSSTDYGNFLQNESSPISTTTLAEKCTVRRCAGTAHADHLHTCALRRHHGDTVTVKPSSRALPSRRRISLSRSSSSSRRKPSSPWRLSWTTSRELPAPRQPSSACVPSKHVPRGCQGTGT